MNKPVMPEKFDYWCNCLSSMADGAGPVHLSDCPVSVIEAHHAAWEAHCAQLEARLEKLRDLCGCAYQMAGVHDAPEEWLDALSDAASETPLDKWRVQGDLIDTLLPYCPPDKAAALEARLREVEGLAGKWTGEASKLVMTTRGYELNPESDTLRNCADELTATLEQSNG